MAEKHSGHAVPYGLLGKAFQFTQDDLSANRAGYMTLPQQFGFKFWERRLYGWFLRLPPISWMITGSRRKALRFSGTTRKHYHSKIIYTGSGGTGGGHQDVIEQRRIEVLAPDGVMTFYVNETQYNALPEHTDVTLYYDPMEHRILSVEPPYEN